MRKITIIFISALFTLTTSAFAGGMVGVKYGTGELDGNAKSYVAGGTTYAAQSGSKDNEFGAIFAEINVKESPISVGLEYVPFDADISLNGKSANVSVNVGDYTTIYALAMKELSNASVYVKVGYSMADIGTVKPNDAATTINSNSSELEGLMYGVGLQTQELPFGLVARAEYTLTDFDDISVTTTSNGSASVKKTASGELTTLTISLAKSF
jgi:hypothetical protein